MYGKGRRAVNRFLEWGIPVGVQALPEFLDLSKFLFVLLFSLHPPAADDPQCNLRILIKELSRLIFK